MPAPRIRYAVSFPDPASHRAQVEMTVEGVGGDALELKMAAWTPGSYLIREFARHVDRVSAEGEGVGALAVEKRDKNSWRVAARGAKRITIRYRLYAFEPTVRTSFVDDERIALNGASVFLFVPGRTHEPVSVALAPPKGMARIVTGLTAAGGNRFTAPDFDRLVDSPLLVGNPAVAEFTVDGKPHEVAVFGRGEYDLKKLAADCEKIVQQGKAIFGALPYDRYAFLLELAPKAGGGLEHLNSAHMFADPFAMARREGYLNTLSLISHEYFHLWNVKRLRPRALGPFDYEKENYTRSLWLAEGVTDYYADLMLRRAGVSTLEEYLKDLTQTVKQYEETPGRLNQPVAEASFDAWVKYYRADEDSGNTAVSYYVKGKLVGWLLDAELRGRSGGKTSLDDLLRRLHAQVEKNGRGYAEDEVKAAVRELVPGDWSGEFFARHVDGAAPVDWTTALKPLGITLKEVAPKVEGREGAGAWLGAGLAGAPGAPLTVSKIPDGSPAAAAGLNVNDEILALDGWRVATPDELGKRLEERAPGAAAELLASRRGRVRTFAVTLGERPPEKFEAGCDPAADEAAKARYRDYFGQDWKAPAPPPAATAPIPISAPAPNGAAGK